MKVGVLGSGDVAKALGAGFLEHGNDVMLGTRDATKLTDWAEQNAEGRVGSFADAAERSGSRPSQLAGDINALLCGMCEQL